MTLTFRVYGVGQPKGSTRAFFRPGMKFPIVTDSNRNAKSWAQLVAEGASRALAQQPETDRGVLCCAVRLSVAVYLPRPKALTTRTKAGPRPHLKKPDLDKLLRGIKDALTQVVWVDDSQVVELVASKHYADVDDTPHVDIRVEPTDGCRAVQVPAAPASLFEGIA